MAEPFNLGLVFSICLGVCLFACKEDPSHSILVLYSLFCLFACKQDPKGKPLGS